MLPTLFYHMHSDLQKRSLLKYKSVEKFSLKPSQTDKCWVEQLIESPTDVAIVQADTFTQEQCDLLLQSGLYTRCDLILISNGEYNPIIDMAMQRSVIHHFKEPLDHDYLDQLLSDLHCDACRKNPVAEGKVVAKLDQFGSLVGSSPIMRQMYRLIHKASDSTASVLIIGETGTGKELVANTIHLGSARSAMPYVALNCGALSPELVESELFGHTKGAFTGAGRERKGAFESANGGTLFLDEITEMPLDQQVKLLRVLESGEFRRLGSDVSQHTDVRIIAATNRKPSEAIKDGRLREDLYFRLCQLPVNVPALRTRGSDVEGLARHFLGQRNVAEKTAIDIDSSAIEKINQHTWPGNVRELKFAIERAYLLADTVITADDLIVDNSGVAANQNFEWLEDMSLDDLEQKIILRTLERHSGNKTETAEILGISVKTLYNKLERYNFKPGGEALAADNFQRLATS